MNRRDFVGQSAVAISSLLFPSLNAEGQTRPKQPVIVWAGIPSTPPPQFVIESTFKSFIHGLADVGYVPGQNVSIERTVGAFPGRVATIEEIVSFFKPNIILAPATLEAVAARKITKTIPIVCPALADAVHLGLISSEARPGGNVTGIEPYIAGLPTKQIELAREVVPRGTRLGLLTNMEDPKGPPQVIDLKHACEISGFEVVEANVSTPKDVRGGLERLTSARVDIVVVLQTNLLLFMAEQIGSIAKEQRLPTVFGYREHVINGGLISYGVDLRWCYQRAGSFVDKILKGASPADLPVEFPTKFWSAINLQTAKALDVNIPAMLLAGADEVIE